METSERCGTCGAAPLTRGLPRCEFCGSAAPVAPVAAADPGAAGGSVPELLAKLPAHPEFEHWRSHEPPVGPLRGHYLARSLVGGLCAALSFVLLAVVWMGTTAPAWLRIPLEVALATFTILAAAFAISGMRKAYELPAMALRRLPACVVEKRVHRPGGRRTGGSRLDFVTLELADGTRKEIRVDARTSALVVAGDYGLSYFRGGHMIDFKRAGNRG